VSIKQINPDPSADPGLRPGGLTAPIKILGFLLYTGLIFFVGRISVSYEAHPTGEAVQPLPPDTVLSHVVLTSEKHESIGTDSLRFILEFRCVAPFQKQYTVFMHGYPADISVLPSDQRKSGYLNWDHSPAIQLRSLQPGVSWSDTSIIPLKFLTTSYQFRIGFFNGAEVLRDRIEFSFH
jgi:hypothetical protein